MPEASKDCYEFGPFSLGVRERRLSRNGERLPLTPKDFETLLLLVVNRDRVVSKAELMKALWPDSFVEDGNLTQHVFTLRKALGDQTDGKPYIETFPRLGYRFAAPVREAVEEQNIAPPVAARKWARSWGRRGAYASLAAAALIAALFAAWSALPTPRESPGLQSYRSIAVLPFKSISSESPEQDHLGVGLADTLISKLSNMSEIVVRPTTAIQRYTKPGEDLAAIGRALRVDAVLDGTIQRFGDQIRVSVQLVSTTTGAPVWSEIHDAPWTDVFTVQDAIAGRVANTLLLKALTPGRETRNAEAYRAYLLGRYYWNKRTEEGLRKAVVSFQQAIALDPEYARAYAGLADSYILMMAFSMGPPETVMPKARAAASRSLDLDERLGEAHASLAFLHWTDCQWDEAGQAFRRAIDLTPGYATAHHWYSLYLKDLGRFEEAVAEMRRAEELDPLSLVISADVGLVLYFARRYDAALEQYRKTFEMDPGFALVHTYQGYAYDGKALYEDAIAAYAKLNDPSANERAHLLRAYALSGRVADAKRVLAELQQFSRHRYVRPETFGFALLALGERDRGWALYEGQYAGREGCLIGLDSDPRFDLVRGDARFVALMHRARESLDRETAAR